MENLEVWLPLLEGISHRSNEPYAYFVMQITIVDIGINLFLKIELIQFSIQCTCKTQIYFEKLHIQFHFLQTELCSSNTLLFKYTFRLHHSFIPTHNFQPIHYLLQPPKFPFYYNQPSQFPTHHQSIKNSPQLSS